MHDQIFTRRAFVNVTSVAAVTIAETTPPKQTACDRVRVAFVGVGWRGTYLLSEILKLPSASVIAVCDIDPDRAVRAAETVARTGSSARVWTDFRKMLDEEGEIDAVVQATPTYTHKHIDIAALDVGKHLYAEKPLARTPEECKMVLTAARQAKGVFHVGLTNRYDPKVNAAQKFIRDGGIGKVLVCQGMRNSRGAPFKGLSAWYSEKEKSGGWPVDVAIHELDLFNWAIGSHPLWAFGDGGVNLYDEPPGKAVLDNCHALFRYPNEVRAIMTNHSFEPRGFITGWPPWQKVFGSRGAVDIRQARWQPLEQKKVIDLEVPNVGQTSAYLALAAFLESIREKKQSFASAEVAYEATMTALLYEKAVEECRLVKWEELAG